MIKIDRRVVKNQKNFWNNCIFHPTDAVEDPWGRRILDRVAKDKAINTVRIYAMFEDIVYEDENGEIAYDFRVSDLRLDYLVEQGYDILIAYGMIPKCLSSDSSATSNVNKAKTRYKGKLLYISKPKDYKIWEDICYEYTKHIVERYGIETVSKWHLHCYNEPDIVEFFLPDIPGEEVGIRCEEYMKLYEGFVNGILRCTDKLCIGGPSLANNIPFLEEFLTKVKERNLRLDYIALHNYAKAFPHVLPESGFNVNNWIREINKYLQSIKKCGFENTEIVVDEWGMATHGFFNVEECPMLIERETEVFSSYYVRLINQIIENGLNISTLMICLSGQHEMVVDFSGFRNFFTLNFIAKPIYNAYVLASKLHQGILNVSCENKNIYVVPTKNENGDMAVMLTYASDRHEERSVPDITETLQFEEDIKDKRIILWCIDKDTTNPYNLYKKLGEPEMDEKTIKILKEEGTLKPVKKFAGKNDIELNLTANCVYLVEIKAE